jgi:nucleoside-diphosphate-sugar epimerase
VSKWEAEQGLQKIGADTGMEIVIVRPPLVYGAGVKANFSELIRLVDKKWPLPFGAVNNRRSFIAIDNLIDFILICIDHRNAAGEVFLVSDGDDVSTAELVRRIAMAQGRKVYLWPIPVQMLLTLSWLFGKRQSMARLCGNLQLDNSKALCLLNWQPKIKMNDALKKISFN